MLAEAEARLAACPCPAVARGRIAAHVDLDQAALSLRVVLGAEEDEDDRDCGKHGADDHGRCPVARNETHE